MNSSIVIYVLLVLLFNYNDGKTAQILTGTTHSAFPTATATPIPIIPRVFINSAISLDPQYKTQPTIFQPHQNTLPDKLFYNLSYFIPK